MPTYTYEYIDDDGTPRRMEIFQKMDDLPLERDPVTGRKLRKVLAVGGGIRTGTLRRSTVVDKTSAAATACGCAKGGHHRHR